MPPAIMKAHYDLLMKLVNGRRLAYSWQLDNVYCISSCFFCFWFWRFLGIAQLLQSLLMQNKKLLFFTVRCMAILFIVWLYFSFDAANYSFFPSCLFYKYTHLYCPGCGSQRCLSALFHGHLLKALSYNILLVMSLPFVFYSAVVYTVNVFRQKQITQKLVLLALFYSNLFVDGSCFFYCKKFAVCFFIGFTASISFWFRCIFYRREQELKRLRREMKLRANFSFSFLCGGTNY